MTFMYLTFGEKSEYHVQAYLSMLSFRRQTSPGDRIVMVTTAPQFYRRASSWVEVIELSPSQVAAWKGRHQYMFRVKTMAMKHYADEHPGEDLLFVDTDTFLSGRLDELRGVLGRGCGLMHKDEGSPADMKGPSLRMWRNVEGREYAGFRINRQHHMWNSGIVGMPAAKVQDIVGDTLLLLDGMLDDGVKSFNIEQYAMSVAMTEHLTVEAAEPWVAHYWGNKDEWERAIQDFMLRAYVQDWTLDDELQAVDELLSRHIPIFVHRSNTARRLNKLVEKLFPDRDYCYF